MAENKKKIDFTTLWKKDDWMSVWIGFFILIIFMAGATFKLPGWKWMTDGAFFEKSVTLPAKAEALAKEAEGKGDLGVQAAVMSLKTALEGKDRKAIGTAAGALEKAAKDAKDKDIKKKAEKMGKDIKSDAGNTAGKVFSGENMTKAFWLLVGMWVSAASEWQLWVLVLENSLLDSPSSLFSLHLHFSCQGTQWSITMDLRLFSGL